MTIGENIRKARKKAGMTQKELADKLGISYVGISQWENGLRKPKVETIQKIARSLNVQFSDLLGVKDEANRDTVNRITEKFPPDFLEEIEDGNFRFHYYTHSDEEIAINLAFRKLNERGQLKAIEQVQDLAKIPEYQNNNRPAQEAPKPSKEEKPQDK